MATYPPERKEAICRQLFASEGVCIAQLARDTGIGESTLYHWRQERQTTPGVVMSKSNKPRKQWSSAEKFAVVLETAAMNEAERAEYARRKGLFVEQIAAWTIACRDANGALVERPENRADKKRIHELERELNRKERALAEAAALLVLQKKARTIWGGEDV
jgi:hypothetical protein